MEQNRLKIGTRGSPLALVQTSMVEAKLRTVKPDLQIERVIIKTSGDWKPSDGETRLAETAGGKGLFALEIEEALLAGSIDCAVHSLKDMSSFLPDGLAIDHVLEREDPRDAFICLKANHFMDLPHGAVVGTSSLRRQAFLMQKRPDLKSVPLRGNVHTRIEKLKEGQVDATFLAMAGLKRLGIQESFIHPIDDSEILPACAQGIVGIETCIDDRKVRSLLDQIHHSSTGLCAAMERAALQTLDGSCHTPIGAYARFKGDDILFDLKVASCDGARVYAEQTTVRARTMEEAARAGHDIAGKLKPNIPADIFV